MIDAIVRLLRGRKLRRIVTTAVAALCSQRGPVAVAVAHDPDRAFELAVRAAADTLGLDVNPREVRLAVAEVALEVQLARLGAAAERLRANLERLFPESGK